MWRSLKWMWVLTNALIELGELSNWKVGLNQRPQCKIRHFSSVLQTVNGIIPKFAWSCLLNLHYLKQIWSGFMQVVYFRVAVISNYCLDLFSRSFLISNNIALPHCRNLVNMLILRVCSLLATTRSTETTPETFGASTTSQLLLGLGTVCIRKRLATLIQLGFGNAPSLGFHGIYGRQGIWSNQDWSRSWNHMEVS